jgi:hypothetical protein
MSLTFAREFARGLDRLGYLQIGYSRGTIPNRWGNILARLVSKFSEGFRSVGIRRHRTNESLGSCFRAGGAERWPACPTWRAS